MPGITSDSSSDTKSTPAASAALPATIDIEFDGNIITTRNREFIRADYEVRRTLECYRLESSEYNKALYNKALQIYQRLRTMITTAAQDRPTSVVSRPLTFEAICTFYAKDDDNALIASKCENTIQAKSDSPPSRINLGEATEQKKIHTAPAVSAPQKTVATNTKTLTNPQPITQTFLKNFTYLNRSHWHFFWSSLTDRLQRESKYLIQHITAATTYHELMTHVIKTMSNVYAYRLSCNKGDAPSAAKSRFEEDLVTALKACELSHLPSTIKNQTAISHIEKQIAALHTRITALPLHSYPDSKKTFKPEAVETFLRTGDSRELQPYLREKLHSVSNLQLTIANLQATDIFFQPHYEETNYTPLP